MDQERFFDKVIAETVADLSKLRDENGDIYLSFNPTIGSHCCMAKIADLMTFVAREGTVYYQLSWWQNFINRKTIKKCGNLVRCKDPTKPYINIEDFVMAEEKKYKSYNLYTAIYDEYYAQ